jgi:hypothetical protein
MGRSPRGPGAVLAALLAACVARASRPIPAGGAGGPGGAFGTPDEIQAVVRQALLLDAAGDRAADTLYAAGAIVVANARIRFAAPRFAGIGAGGRVTIAGATATLEGRFAWVLVDYRWVNSAQPQAEAGRATVVCERQPGGWKIVHAHSSQLLPWDR